jgi:ACS family hexuronate transporter-like MFS transporter
MFGSTVLNYMDRQAIALVRPQVMAAYGIRFETFGWVLAAFSLVYALCQVPAGFLADRWDVRRLYAAAVVWWSLAGMAASFAPVLGVLVACRALLGVGESFNWPCALRVTSRILPPEARSLGNGIFNSGAAVGAVLTPLVVPALTLWLGWRSAFVWIGLLGFGWVAAWLWVTRERARVFAGERAATAGVGGEKPSAGLRGEVWLGFGGLAVVSVLVSVLGSLWGGPAAVLLGAAVLMVGLLVLARIYALEKLAGSSWLLSLGEVVRRRRFWVLVVVATTINTSWHFLVGWLPTYLKEDRELREMVGWVQRVFPGWFGAAEAGFIASSVLTAVIFLAADAGNLLGGQVTRSLVRRGWNTPRARLVVMAMCAVLISGGTLVGGQGNDWVVLGLLALMALGAAGFMANYFAYCQDVDDRRTGLVVGILGGLGNLFAAGILPFAGWVKDRTGGFGPIFVLVGLAPVIGLLALGMFWGMASEPREGGGVEGV